MRFEQIFFFVHLIDRLFVIYHASFYSLLNMFALINASLNLFMVAIYTGATYFWAIHTVAIYFVAIHTHRITQNGEHVHLHKVWNKLPFSSAQHHLPQVQHEKLKYNCSIMILDELLCADFLKTFVCENNG